MNKTEIEWAECTWNPVTGCLHGCNYCYAQGISYRFQAKDDERILNFECAVRDDKNPMAFVLKERIQVQSCLSGKTRTCPYPFGFTPTIHEYRLCEPQRWREPRTVFVGSMADLFGAWVPDVWIQQVFDSCAAAPQHNYLFLTKNAGRYDDLKKANILPDWFWYGHSASYPEMAHNLCASKSFISFEPLHKGGWDTPYMREIISEYSWFIIGAETGNRKEKIFTRREWVNEILRVADDFHIPVFMKESLLPVMGEDGMRREFPPALQKGLVRK
jgi:protein gp37